MMQSLDEFNKIFTAGSNAHKMGLKLRGLVASNFENIDETISGGAKVKLALYSRNGTNNVLCGIQQGSNDSCMLYVHHIPELEHDRLKFSGKGKHAKRIKFTDISQISTEDITWLLGKVRENAPY
ncbi:hypothetical protein GTQ34_00260 [Muricauda sp. JGD-17]|uniref:Uncharacterized protein n=1 Tax=Flagellimonas ochracea TaxID=2696472 RepID=A0A964WW14_9FLAO|nr:hypothetical protein [Allomuricauda ochracea]NAY90337.1 hypothetical protein [Allomuricauda ochracea]